MKELLFELFNYFPECTLKNHIRCLYYNHLERNEFRIYYEADHFLVYFKDFSLQFPFNPYYSIVVAVKGYLGKFSLNKGDVVVDAGAYPGVFALIASRMVGNSGRVIAFEPDAERYRHLLDNIRLNNATNVVAISKSVWSEDTTLRTLRFNDACPETSSRSASVAAVSIDNELEKLRIGKVDFIKMDIEGAEIEATRGCKRILQSSDAELAIASYHLVDGEKTCVQLERLLASLGYKTETSFPEHLTTYASR